MLAEIILVDDASTMEHLGKDLENYMAQYPKVSSSSSPKENQVSPTRYYEKGENCPSSEKRGFNQGAPTGGGKGDDEYKI